MDIASLIGTLMGLAMVLFGIIQSAGVSAIWNTYMDFPSAVITIGGSIAGVLACNSMADFINGFKSAEMLLSYIRMTRVRLLEISLIFQILPEKRGFLHWKKQRMILMMTF